MNVRNWKRAAVWFMLPALVLLCCTGCKKKEENGFSEMRLEEEISGSTEESEEAGNPGEETEDQSTLEKEETGKKEPEKKEAELVFVHVCGAVVSPGVYGMEADARVYEAVACAGGLLEEAADEAVNQAQKVKDGERIYIPTQEEVMSGLVLPAEEETDLAAGSSKEGDDAQTGNTDGKVNINTASAEELKTLGGIGDTRAESILRYREENGSFQSIEELMNVEGIKEGVFEKIKDRITVNTGS